MYLNGKEQHFLFFFLKTHFFFSFLPSFRRSHVKLLTHTATNLPDLDHCTDTDHCLPYKYANIQTHTPKPHTTHQISLLIQTVIVCCLYIRPCSCIVFFQYVAVLFHKKYCRNLLHLLYFSLFWLPLWCAFEGFSINTCTLKPRCCSTPYFVKVIYQCLKRSLKKKKAHEHTATQHHSVMFNSFF